VLKDKVLEGCELWGPDQKVVHVTTVPGDKQRIGSVVVESEGVHVLGFSLRRPRAPEPSYEAKALVVVNAERDDRANYGLGHGLELVPEKAISTLRKNDDLPISLSLDGKRMAGSLEVVAEKGKGSFLKAGPDRPAVIRIRQAGRYLVAANVGGRRCSLIFEIRMQEGDKP
jgi:hypothetical protein